MLTELPRVSIVIPAYNAMDYLPETLASALGQTLEDFEVIIVNDGSSDGIEEWFYRTVTDSRVTLISKSNGGQSSARNLGIRNAKGSYVAFLDADDLWRPDKLQQQVKALDGDPAAGVAYSWVACIDESGKFNGKVRQNYAEGWIFSDLLMRNIVVCGSNAMVRRDCIDKVGMFDGSVNGVEDLDLCLRLAQHYTFRLIPETLVYYRNHGSSFSRSWLVMEKSLIKLLDRAFASAPSEYSCLKPKSYAAAYLSLGWKALQSQHRDYKDSRRLLRMATRHHPGLRLTVEYWRLWVVMTIAQCFGSGGYEFLFQMVTRLRILFRSLRPSSYNPYKSN